MQMPMDFCFLVTPNECLLEKPNGTLNLSSKNEC